MKTIKLLLQQYISRIDLEHAIRCGEGITRDRGTLVYKPRSAHKKTKFELGYLQRHDLEELAFTIVNCFGTLT